MTAGAAPATWERLSVDPGGIVKEPKVFKTRYGELDRIHVRMLAAAIKRRGGRGLAPVLLWKQEGRNSLVLLDGEHRLAAYEAAGWRGGIPARVASCGRRDALLIAAGANTRDVKPLSHSERADVAWKLVREPDAKFTKTEIARVSGIAERTVTTMRARWKTMQEAKKEPTGRWWRDRKDDENDEGPMQEMTDEERRAEIEALAGKLRKAAGHTAFRDEQMFAEALDVAIGPKLRAAIDFLFDPWEADSWLGIRTPEPDDGPSSF